MKNNEFSNKLEPLNWWVRFKRGHAQYSVYALQLLNFLGLALLVIERIFGISYYIYFFAAFLFGYPLVNLKLGTWDFKAGTFPEEARIQAMNNPYIQAEAKTIVALSRVIINHIEGRQADLQEVQIMLQAMEQWCGN